MNIVGNISNGEGAALGIERSALLEKHGHFTDLYYIFISTRNVNACNAICEPEFSHSELLNFMQNKLLGSLVW